MDEREVLLKYMERQNVNILYKDFYSTKISNSLQQKHGLSQWRNRLLTRQMILDDAFWEVYKTTSTHRYTKKDQRYKTIMYVSRRDAYDLVRKDALANAKSDD